MRNENGTDNGFGGGSYAGQGFAFQDIFYVRLP